MLILAQEIEAITQTLDNLMTVDLPRLIGIFGVLLILAIIVMQIAYWRISNNNSRADSQQFQLTAQTMTNLNDYLKTEKEVNRVKLDLAIQEIRSGHKAIMDSFTLQSTAMEGLARRISDLFSVMDTQLETMQQRMIASEATHKDNVQKMTDVGQKLESDMSEVKDGNQEILNELRTIRDEIKRMADSVEKAMGNLTETVNKLTDPKRLTVIENVKVETKTGDIEDSNA